MRGRRADFKGRAILVAAHGHFALGSHLNTRIELPLPKTAAHLLKVAYLKINIWLILSNVDEKKKLTPIWSYLSTLWNFAKIQKKPNLKRRKVFWPYLVEGFKWIVSGANILFNLIFNSFYEFETFNSWKYLVYQIISQGTWRRGCSNYNVL